MNVEKRHYSKDIFMRAAAGERTERTPVWFMRQAGRTDPEYMRLKEEAGLPLQDLFRHPELAARVSLLPKRIGVDAIIYFQDILTPLAPMGAEFIFSPGPELANFTPTAENLGKLHNYDMAEELPFIPEIFRLIHKSLDGELPVLGFAGAPFTLASFILEGRSPGQKALTTAGFMVKKTEVLHALLETITTMTIDYLRFQIEAGAGAVQLFESCSHLLNQDQYKEFALPYQQRIFETLRGSAPTIMFAREWPHLSDLAAAGANIVSLPSSVTIAEARQQLGPDHVIQGNLDNDRLAHGLMDDVRIEARCCVEEGGHRGHIFNLSHGLLRDTPFERIVELVQFVKGIQVE
jgi:uroporphyrinogen decarboxylase